MWTPPSASTTKLADSQKFGRLRLGRLLDRVVEHLAVAAPGGNGPDDLLSTTPSGTAVRHTSFYRRQFRPAVEQALPAEKRGLRFHDLRHTAAAFSFAVSPNLHAVKERLGHSDIALTVNAYGHLVPSVDEATATGLADLFSARDPDNVVPLPRSAAD